jgi:hypothetical protein
VFAALSSDAIGPWSTKMTAMGPDGNLTGYLTRLREPIHLNTYLSGYYNSRGVLTCG